MEFRRRKPCAVLAGFVDLLWYWDGPTRPHSYERLLPDGSMELVINLHDDEIRVYDPRDIRSFQRLEAAVLVGPHSEYFVLDTTQQVRVIGVHFRPGGAFPFLRPPADELHGQHVAMSELWGAFARELRERLLLAATVDARFDLVEAALTARIARPLEHHRAVAFGLREFLCGTRSVADVIETAGISSRRFIEVFKQQVGMAPKQYCRVQRFQRVIRGLPAAKAIDWADVAAANGYCDQAHLIHEFRAIAGISPGEYIARRTEHLNHVPMEVSVG
jgi:AraC-like DNA-binding protein